MTTASTTNRLRRLGARAAVAALMPAMLAAPAAALAHRNVHPPHGVPALPGSVPSQPASQPMSQPVIALPTVSAAPVHLTHGAVPVTLACPPESQGPCEGELAIDVPGHAARQVVAAHLHAAPVHGSSQRFQLDPGTQATIAVSLDTRSARALAGRRGMIRVSVTVVLETSAGPQVEVKQLSVDAGHGAASAGTAPSHRGSRSVLHAAG